MMILAPPAAAPWPALMAGVTLGTMAGLLGAAELRVVTWNVENGVGAPGSAAFGAVRETLERLDPDVIAFQEVDAQNPVPTHGAHFADVRALLTALGFPTTRAHLATAGDGTQAQVFVAGDFGNSSQCLAVASRHPILRTVQIGRGATGRREQTRFPLFVVIDVPGLNLPVAMVAVHLKQGDTSADEFRRAVEAWRVREFLEAEGWMGTNHHLLVLGDMNEELNEPQTASFSTTGTVGGREFSDGSALPLGFVLGPGVPDVLRYAVFPASGFAAIDLNVVPATQTDGVTDRTYTFAGNSRLDYVLAGGFTRAAGVVRAEVYHSGREPVGDGLPKAPSLPAPELSVTASDHLPLVVDVALASQPALSLSLPTVAQVVGFEPPAVVSTGSVRLPAALDAPMTVTIAPFRPAPVASIPPVVIAAGETSATFPLVVAGSPFTPDRRVTLVATAPGYRTGIGVLPTRGTGVAGPLIISQYTETPSGSSPKALEIMNVSGREINFASEPLQVLSFASGSSTGAVEVLVEFGRLPPRAVVVLGDSATGSHLIATGLLAATASAVAGAETNTLFTDTGDPDGRAVYIKRGFRFNGDDALEVRLNAQRCDIFGAIGEDPGTAWAADGISTANQNLARLRTAIMPSAGWTVPGLAFEVAGTTPTTALSGFGVAPEIDDPYAEWAADRGLAGASAAVDADPDHDGVANGVAFVFGESAGAMLRGSSPVSGQWQWQVDAPVRSRLGTLRWGVSVAEDAAGWRTLWEATAPLVPGSDEFISWRRTLPTTAAPSGRARFFVIRP